MNVKKKTESTQHRSDIFASRLRALYIYLYIVLRVLKAPAAEIELNLNARAIS